METFKWCFHDEINIKEANSNHKEIIKHKAITAASEAIANGLNQKEILINAQKAIKVYLENQNDILTNKKDRKNIVNHDTTRSHFHRHFGPTARPGDSEKGHVNF